MTFTNDQIEALVTALPGCIGAQRRSLLPRIFEEWSRTDLKQHSALARPKQLRVQCRQLRKVENRARELARALSELESQPRYVIATRILEMDGVFRVGSEGHEERAEADRRLGEEPRKLDQLAKAAAEASKFLNPLPHRQSTMIRYLVLQDLAAIYEWATGQRAGRRVRTDIDIDAGKTYGPFWDFASAAWPIIFGSVRGLDSALKTWAKAKRRFKESSPIIWNLDLRYPQWQIRGTSRSKSAIRLR